MGIHVVGLLKPISGRRKYCRPASYRINVSITSNASNERQLVGNVEVAVYSLRNSSSGSNSLLRDFLLRNALMQKCIPPYEDSRYIIQMYAHNHLE